MQAGGVGGAGVGAGVGAQTPLTQDISGTSFVIVPVAHNPI